MDQYIKRNGVTILLLLVVALLPFGCCDDCDDDNGPPTGTELGISPAPNTFITSGPEGTVASGDVSFAWRGESRTDNDADLVFSYRLDPIEGQWSDYSPSTMIDYQGLADGAYVFMVRARDTSGNVDPSPAERSFTVDPSGGEDTTPPDTEITSGPHGTIDIDEAGFTYIGEDDTDNSADLVYAHKLYVTAAGEGSVPWSSWNSSTYAKFTGLADESYTFAVKARDTAGNEDPTPDSQSFTVDTGGTPTGGIEFSFVSTSAVGEPGEEIVFTGTVTNTMSESGEFHFWATTNMPAGWTFNFCIGPICVFDEFTTTMEAGETLGVEVHILIDPDAEDGQRGTLELCAELVGDPSINDCVTFVADVSGGGTEDTEPPETFIDSGPSGTVDTPDVDFTFHGEDNMDPPSALVYSYRMDDDPWSAYSSSTSVGFTGLADGPHTFRVRAMDSSNNEDQTPATRNFTVETSGGEGIAFSFESTSTGADPGTAYDFEGTVTNFTDQTTDFHFWIVKNFPSASWVGSFCVGPLCVFDEITLELEAGATEEVKVTFVVPGDAHTGDQATIDFSVEMVSNPAVNDHEHFILTVN